MEFNRGENNGKRKETKVRRTRSGCRSVANSNRDRNAGRSDKLNGAEEQVRIAQPLGNGRNTRRSVLGGIVTQLIEDLEDQLGETQQTIEMLDKKCQRIEKRLNHLRQLQSLVKEESEV